MESGGRSGGGRGKGKKGKKKSVNITHQAGKKGSTNDKVKATGFKTSVPSNATEEGPKSTKVTQDQALTKTKRKRLKKVIDGGNAMLKEQMVTEGGTLKTSGQVQDQLIQKSSNAVAIVKSNEMTLKGAMKKKRKRNVLVKSLTGASDGGQVTTTVSLKEGPTTDGKKSHLIATQSLKKKVSVRSQSLFTLTTATAAKQTETVVATSPKRKIAQVGKVSTKLPIQRTRKSERVATTVDVLAVKASPRKKAKSEKAKTVGLSAASTSVVPKDESQVVVKKPKSMAKVHQSTDVANAAKQMDSPAKGKLMQQQVPQADAAIAMKPKDEVATTSCTTVTTTKQTTADADSSPSTAAFDDNIASSRPAPDASIRNPTISSKPSHTASAAASLSTISGKPVLQEPMPDKATNPPTEISKTSPALVVSACSPQLVTARLVTPPIARSKVTGGRHKRRRSIDQASANSVTDPLQPPIKRSAGSSNDASFQSKADELNEVQSSADGERAALDQLPNSPRYHAASEPANTPVTVQETHASAIKVVAEQATPAVEATPPPPQSEAGIAEKIEAVEVRRCATQPTQLLASMTTLEPASEHDTSLVQTQAALNNDFMPSATQHESAMKAENVASATAPSNDGEVGPQSLAASFESAVTKEVGIVMDSGTYEQKMMSTDMKTSSHGGSSHTQSMQSMASLPPRPQNSWGASFGMVPPAPGASSVSRTLSTTPLSSWFLSKGCANFVKRVQFSDDDEDDADVSSSEDDVPLPRQPSVLHGTDKAPIKRRASATKKNAFLESLTTQSYWRTWYGTVDLHNLIDPPLEYVPDKLRSHEVTPLSLPGPRSHTPMKKNDLESLEADIIQEKQRGSAFSEQLLMMLQGKTVSGKSLEEEYRPLLRQ